jgi:serine/threonine protein kinase
MNEPKIHAVSGYHKNLGGNSMSELQKDQVIQTEGFKTVKVIEQLGEGGQGIVYRVDYGGKPMALKWFKADAWKEPRAVYENLKNNIEKGSPAEGVFLWPKDVTEWVDGTFGYVMDLRPKEYIEFTDVLVSAGGGGFKSFKAIVEVCIQIVSAFRLLHNAGYSYQDMNSGNFFINPKSGKAMICDNDNVAPDGTLKLKDKVRGRKGALGTLFKQMKRSLKPDTKLDTVLISHSDCLEDAEALAGIVRSSIDVREIMLVMMCPVIGAHVGPGTVALFFEADMTRTEYEGKFYSK